MPKPPAGFRKPVPAQLQAGGVPPTIVAESPN